jgi:hypothetical protein
MTAHFANDLPTAAGIRAMLDRIRCGHIAHEEAFFKIK